MPKSKPAASAKPASNAKPRTPKKKAARTTPARNARTARGAASRREGARARMYHDLVFESAECVFGDKGFDHATMQDVAHEAGISLKTLYTYFAGKQEIYAEIQRVRGASFVEFVLARTALGSEPLERLALWVRAYVDFLFAHRDWLHIHLQIGTSWGLRPTEEGAAEYWQQGLEGVGGILASGMQAGLFHETDSNRLAAIVLAVMQVQVAQAVEAAESDAEQVAAEIMVQLERLLRTQHV